MSDRLLGAVRQAVYRRDADRARICQAGHLARKTRAAQEAIAEFARRLRVRPGRGDILVARGRDEVGEAYWIGMSVEQLLSTHAFLCGATGSGKTFLALGLLIQVLRRDHPIVVLDMKGELADLLITVVLPALAGTPLGPRLLANLRIVRPFDREFLPHLRITETEPDVSAVAQAFSLTAAVEEALDEPMGPRMRRVFLRMASLAVERGEPLPVISEWLARPSRFAKAASASSDPDLRAYALEGLGREDANSVEAVRARLDTFLFLPETRLALSALSCVSFRECLESGLTIIDCSNPPVGSERLSRFWSGLLLGRLTRAILTREVRDDSPRAWLIAEEWQEALGAHQAEQWGRLLSLARFKRTAVWSLNQAPAQIAAVSPTLLKLLRTNTGIEAVFRSSYEDAVVLAPLLFTPTEDKSPKEARDELVREIVRLPRRSFYLHVKDLSCQAQLVRSPRVDLERLRAQAASVSPDVARAIRQGTVASPHDELERLVRVRREHARPLSPIEELLPARSPDQNTASPFPVLG